MRRRPAHSSENDARPSDGRCVGVSADVLSDVLRAVRLTGAVYLDFELSSPWVAEAPPSREIAATVMPGAERVIESHLIAHGACWGQVVGQEPIRLNEGDFIVFPQGDAHTMSSAPGMRATPDMSLFARPTTPLPLVYERGGGGPESDPDCLLLSRLRRTSIQPAARRPAESDSPFCGARRGDGMARDAPQHRSARVG